MKRVCELDVYKLAEELPDMVWYDFDKWNKKVQTRLPTPGTGGQDTVGYQIIRSTTVQKHEGRIYRENTFISNPRGTCYAFHRADPRGHTREEPFNDLNCSRSMAVGRGGIITNDLS